MAQVGGAAVVDALTDLELADVTSVTMASATITSADINGGAIDGTTIGANTAAAGTFTDIDLMKAVGTVHRSTNPTDFSQTARSRH